MSDLTFNKMAAAVLGTGFAIAILTQVTGRVFEQEPVKTPGYAVEVAAGGDEGGAAVVDTLPDWGTVLPTADVAAGAAVFEKCRSCHTAEAGGPNGTGPNLNGVEGRKPGSHAGFGYSANMLAFSAKQPVWDYDHIYEFLKNPKAYIADTKMTFVGLKKPEDRIAVIAYLKSQGGTLPIPAPDPSRAPGAAAAAAAPPAGAAPAAPATSAPAPAPAAAAPAAAAPATPPTK